MAMLDVLWTSQTAEVSVDHDGQPCTQVLTFFHAAIQNKKIKKTIIEENNYQDLDMAKVKGAKVHGKDMSRFILTKFRLQ